MCDRKEISIGIYIAIQVIFHACCVCVMAQQKMHIPRNTILFAPLNAFDIVNPSIQMGYERMITKKLAVQVEAGYITHHSIPNLVIDLATGVNIKDCPYTNKGYRLRTEAKYFIILKRKTGFYTSLEAFYLENRSGVRESFRIADPGFPYPDPPPAGGNAYDDFFYNKKEKYGMNMKFGFRFFPKTSGFVLESYVGLGLAFRKNQHADRMNIQDKLLYNSMLFDRDEGNKWMFNFPFNIKLGHRF